MNFEAYPLAVICVGKPEAEGMDLNESLLLEGIVSLHTIIYLVYLYLFFLLAEDGKFQTISVAAYAVVSCAPTWSSSVAIPT